MSEKLDAEAEGIFLWCPEGLKRLIARNYEFTISDRANRNLEGAVEESNNIVQFMQSSGYIRLEQGTAARSVHLYTAYKRWCKDNLEIPLSQKTFSQYFIQNAGAYGAQFASTDCPFRMSGAGSSVETVWVLGRIFYLFSGVRSRIFFPFISKR